MTMVHHLPVFDVICLHLSPQNLAVFLCMMVALVNGKECPRKQSQIVRQIIRQEVQPLFEELNVQIPRGCPLSAARDIYGVQEDNKYEESNTKWVCNFCGKAFHEERFLDQHFMNRHPHSLRKDSDVVCLADFCDIFRCEVVASTSKGQSNYWDRALCREDILQKNQAKCLELIPNCIPSNPSDSVKNTLQSHLNNTLCRYLTCEMYWELHDSQMSALTIVFYMMGSMVLIFGLCVYFMVLRVHLSENPPQLLRSEGHSESSEDDMPKLFTHKTQDMRYRHRYH